MQRIAQILLSPRIGGAETLATCLEEEWRSRGIESQIIYLDQKGQEKSRVRRVRELRRRLHEFAPDAVIAHSYLPSLYARAVWGSRAPVHSVLHSASDDFGGRRSRFVERALGPRTASVIAVSESQASRYRARFPRMRVTRIENGVNGAIRCRAGFSAEPRRIVTIARVAPQKRPAFWNAVVREMFNRYPDLRFEWWGPLSGNDAIDDHVRLVPPSASHMGATTQLDDVLDSADILFHPSAREAHSIALLEGAVSGLPVVYADSIERPHDHVAWRNRYLSDDVDSAVQALEHVITHWRTESAQALRYATMARSQFGISGTAEKYVRWITSTAKEDVDG